MKASDLHSILSSRLEKEEIAPPETYLWRHERPFRPPQQLPEGEACGS
jgi:hypothetical protein